MAIVRIVRKLGWNRASDSDRVAWFSNAESMKTLYGTPIDYEFAYKIGRERQLKTVTNESVGPEDLKPGEEALCVNTTFSLNVAYTSHVDLVAVTRGAVRFVKGLHHGNDPDQFISARIRLTLNFVRGDEIDLTVARLLLSFMEGKRSIYRVDLEGKISAELSEENVCQEIQTFLTERRYGGADLEARANSELRGYLNEKYFTRESKEKLLKCLELQRVAARVWTY